MTQRPAAVSTTVEGRRQEFRQPASAKLFVIFAKDADEAVIFRRGPTRWFHVIQWNTRRDSFLPGAWIKGRIYPERCDLSPNGELLLYAVHQGRMLGSSYTDAWTAISRSPWLHALGLWPQGTTWNGGGRFVGNRRAVLRGGCIGAPPSHPAIGLDISFGNTVEYHASSEEVPGADWSGRDRSGRLIYSLGGWLICRPEKPLGDILLADFSGCSPDPQPAPRSAMVQLHPFRHALSTRRPAKGRPQRFARDHKDDRE